MYMYVCMYFVTTCRYSEYPPLNIKGAFVCFKLNHPPISWKINSDCVMKITIVMTLTVFCVALKFLKLSILLNNDNIPIFP